MAWKNEKKIKRADGNSHDEIQIKLLQIAQQMLLVYPINPVYNNVEKQIMHKCNWQDPRLLISKEK